MTDEDVKSMFRLAADVRRMPPGDPRREQAEGLLRGMTQVYVAENVVSPGAEPAEPGPEWQEALEYVKYIFARLDSAENDAGCAAARAEWLRLLADACEKAYGETGRKPIVP